MTIVPNIVTISTDFIIKCEAAGLCKGKYCFVINAETWYEFVRFYLSDIFDLYHFTIMGHPCRRVVSDCPIKLEITEI